MRLPRDDVFEAFPMDSFKHVVNSPRKRASDSSFRDGFCRWILQLNPAFRFRLRQHRYGC